jgi:hypothetical protein
MFYFGNITAHGAVYLYPEKPPQDLMWVDPKGHTNFWCSVLGDLSGSSSSPRTETRETLPRSGEPYNWVAGEAVHTLTGKVRLELIPSSGKVIVGQIHAYKASNPFLMVTWWNGVARIDFREVPNGLTTKALSVPCPLGESFEYKIEIDKSGMLTVTINGLGFQTQVSPLWTAFPFYFKAGAYVIDNSGPETEGGWVVYENFEVSHLS